MKNGGRNGIKNEGRNGIKNGGRNGMKNGGRIRRNGMKNGCRHGMKNGGRNGMKNGVGSVSKRDFKNLKEGRNRRIGFFGYSFYPNQWAEKRGGN